jgi:cell division protein FtsQ
MRRQPTTAPHDAPSDAALLAEVRWMNITSNLFFTLAAAAVLVLFAAWLARQPLFTLRSIRIEGDVVHNSVATIRANANPKLWGNFFTMNLSEGQQAFEAVPWVRRAVVQREWPNRLKVTLEEHRAAAIWSAGDAVNDKLVNMHGEVFEANLGDVEDEGLITLRGPEGKAAQMLTMAHALNPVWLQMQTKADSLLLSSRGSWRVVLDTGAELELGRGTPQELRARSEQFASTVGQMTARYQRPVQYADLRHRDGYALRLRGVSTTLTATERSEADKADKAAHRAATSKPKP